MSVDEQDEFKVVTGFEDDLIFEENLRKKVEAKNKQKKEKKEAVERYYLDPDELEVNLREHVIMRSINPNHVMSRKLGRNIMTLVAEYAEGGQFRSYYNGWKEDMKSRAHEHICRYAHGYRINYVKTLEFFLRWIFRKKTYALQSWLADRGISYQKFYLSLLEVKIKTPNGKEKSKMGRKIFESDMHKMNNPLILKDLLDDAHKDNPPEGIVFTEDSFKEEIFGKWPETLRLDFDEQIRRNPFNYLTKYAYNAFIAVIKEEKAVSDNSQSFEEKMKYNPDSFDEENHGSEDRYTQLDENRIDWDVKIFE
jgi:hypothetical protein